MHSFQKTSLRMPVDDRSLTNGERGYEASCRTEPKRPHHWFMETSEPQMFGNKKQATEAFNNRPISANPNVNFSLWKDDSSFQPVLEQFTGPESIMTSNLGGKNISSVGGSILIRERNDFEDQVGNASLVSLSVSCAMQCPSPFLDYGVTKVKGNHVRDSENGVSLAMQHFYRSRDNHTLSLGPPCDDGIGPTFQKSDSNFYSLGHPFIKGDGNAPLMGHDYDKGYNRGDGNYFLVEHQYEKGNDNVISIAPDHNKGDANFISMGSTYSKADKSSMPMVHTVDEESDNTLLVAPTHDKVDISVVPKGNGKGGTTCSVSSVAENHNKDEGTTISFGGSQGDSEAYDASGSAITSYDLSMNETSVQPSKEQGQNDLVEGRTDAQASVGVVATSKTSTVSKKKEPKKKDPKAPKTTPPNSFPSNVKSLLSTGILDGVPVKYVSWSREKQLRGIIKGSSYLCGCNECNFSKALNAYAFERHTGCKTKHPNNNIYFENGKTIYAVVQELKSTSQEVLFDVIQSITGSPIDQKNFTAWKASYLAASRELQRIYGKDEEAVPSQC